MRHHIIQQVIRGTATLFGVLLLIFFVLGLAFSFIFLANLPEVSGVVIAITIQDQPTRPVVTLRLEDGRIVTFHPRSTDEYMVLPKVGETIPVVLDPSDPRGFVPLWNEPDPRKPSLSLLGSSLLIGVTLIILGLRRPQQAAIPSPK